MSPQLPHSGECKSRRGVLGIIGCFADPGLRRLYLSSASASSTSPSTASPVGLAPPPVPLYLYTSSPSTGSCRSPVESFSPCSHWLGVEVWALALPLACLAAFFSTPPSSQQVKQLLVWSSLFRFVCLVRQLASGYYSGYRLLQWLVLSP
jgi:hypothetical protein